MTECMENAQSIFAAMSDYAVSAYVKMNYAQRIEYLRSDWNYDYGANAVEQTSQALLLLCLRYAEENSL